MAGLTYGMINLVAGLEKLVANPSYRPTLNVPSAVSLAGAAACFWVMFVINAPACVAALVIENGVWLLLHRRGLRVRWGDMRQGIWLSLARYALINLKAQPRNPRNWRPHILLFAGDVDKRLELVRFASWLNQDRGILTVCHLFEGELECDGDAILEQEELIDEALDRRDLVTFSEVNVVRDFEEGVLNVAQANGIAGLTSNTLMFGWSDYPERLASYLRIMRKVARLRQSLVICRIAPRTFERSKQIDIWWRGQQYNGDLLLLLAHLLSLNPEWQGARIAVKSIASSEHTRESLEDDMAKLVPRMRIQADTQVILKPQEYTVREVMQKESREAEVVFLGLMEPEAGEEMKYAERLQQMVENFPSVVLVRNSGWFVGELV